MVAGRRTHLLQVGGPIGRYTNDKQVITAVASMVAELGFDPELEQLEWGSYWAKASEGEYDLFYVGWAGRNYDIADFKAIYMVPAEGGEIREITSEADSVGDGAIAFSPDGERITFFSGGAIKTIPVKGGQLEVLVAEVGSGRHSQLEWSPDGSRIAHNAGGKIWITPLDGGAPEELRTGLPENAGLSEFGWSPDGEKIVFMASIGGKLELWLISDFLPAGR